MGKHGIERSRYDFISGSFFDSSGIPACQAYLMRFIIADWSDEKAVEILKSVHQAAREHKSSTGNTPVTLYLIELLLDEKSELDGSWH